MPLASGSSQATISRNIAELVRAGHKPDQAEAIAYRQAGQDAETAQDMTPDDWAKLASGLAKWMREEAVEPEHAEDETEAKELAPEETGAQDSLALDRGTVRSYDADGRMHVETAHISKANVCPYKGAEIPDYEALGLDAAKVYQLYRDPAELAKGADTFNNIPLLNKHVPISVDDYQPDDVVGSTGTDATFKAPYLNNSLVIWDAAAIRGIESNRQREISCAYRYRADMTPGNVNGVSFDGVMRDIVANHVALVETGRAGPDVMVGDSSCGVLNMKLKSRAALRAEGAIISYIRPKLVPGAKIALDAALGDVTAKNWQSKKGAIVTAVRKATSGKLAKDADLDGMHKFLDSLDDEQKAAADEEDDMVDATDEDDDDKKAEDEEDEPRKFLKSKLSAEDWKAYDEMCAARSAEDEGSELMGTEGGRKTDEAASKPISNMKAMDERIRLATDGVRRATIAEMNAISDAERVVRPYIGELKSRPASAAAVYKLALDAARVDLKDVPESAYSAMVKMLPLPGRVEREQKRPAMDSAGSGVNAHLPGLSRIRQL